MILPNKFEIGDCTLTRKDILIIIIASATSSTSSYVVIDSIKEFEVLPYFFRIVFAMLSSLVLIWLLMSILLIYLQFLYKKRYKKKK